MGHINNILFSLFCAIALQKIFYSVLFAFPSTVADGDAKKIICIFKDMQHLARRM